MTRKTGSEMAEQLSDFINVSSLSERKEFSNAVVTDHRTLQSDAFFMFVKCMKEWAKMYEDGYYDARNEYACKIASKMIEAVRDDI